MNLLRPPALALTLALAAATLLPGAARAQQLLRYDFSNLDGRATTTAPGISAGEFGRDPDSFVFFDNTAGNPAPDANSSGWTTANAPDLASYYTFTLTPAAPTTLTGFSLSAARFDSQGINDGPTRFTLRSSLNNFTTDLGGGTLTAAFTSYSVPFATGTVAAAPVEFRLYGFAAGSDAGLFQVDNVTIVPEPATTTALLAGAAGLSVLAVRRRTRPTA